MRRKVGEAGAPARSGERLWRAVTRTVRPLPGKAPPSEPEASPPIAPVASAPASAPPPTAPPQLQKTPPKARTPGPLADRGAEKRVRRGRVEAERTLDLHGYTQDRAEAALASFLRAAQADGETAVLVVTGKGARLQAGDAAPGVLKRRLPEWLESRAVRPLVAGYALAHRRHGGAGAYYVFLKRAPRP